jgi:hypothetical protein
VPGVGAPGAAGRSHCWEVALGLEADLDSSRTPAASAPHQHLAERMAAGLPIRLNSPVAEIRWAPAAGAVGAAGAPVAVTLESGETLEADAVVCTLPLGVLKAAAAAQKQPGAQQPGASRGLQRFEPPLPPEKVAAIEQMHTGQVNKLFLEFDPPADPPPGGNPTANGRARGVEAGAPGDGSDDGGGFTPQPPPLAYSSRAPAPAAAPEPGRDGEGLVGPRRRVQAGGPRPPPGGLAATATPGATAAALAEGASGAGAGVDGSREGCSGGGVSFTSYCLLWPTDSALWGRAGAPGKGADAAAIAARADALLPLADDLRAAPELPAADPVYAGPAVAGGAGGPLPGWLYGLHSWRWSDGPEWCKPPHGGCGGTSGAAGGAEGGAAAAAAGGGFAPRRAHWAAAWAGPPGSSGWRGRDGYAAVLWVTGRAALALERLSDAEAAAGAAALLAAFPAVPRPGGVPADAVPRAYRSSWCASPYFKGSYSYPGPGADGSTIDALAAPLLSAPAGSGNSEGAGGVLCFAGEATSRAHTGTVHGSFESGEREAARLLEMWGLCA